MSLVRFVSSRSFRRLAAVVAVAAACAAPAAHCQFGGKAGFESAFVADYYARDVSLFVDFLGLEDWQRPIIETLLDDYIASFNAGVEGVRDRMQKIKENLANVPADQVLKRIMAPIDEWASAKVKLREEFVENVKTQLSEGQLEKWPKFERAMRREKSLDKFEIQGEGVNLTTVLKEMQVAPKTMDEIQPAVEEYEIQLDRSLLARQHIIEESQPKYTEAMSRNDQQAGLAATESIMRARVAVRDAQDAGRESVRDALQKTTGDDVAAEFDAMALERAFPKVYRSDPVLPMFENAKAIADLTEEQKSGLDSLESQYRGEVPVANKKLADAFRQEEPKEPRRRVEMMMSRQQPQEPGAAKNVVSRARGEAEVIASARKEREDFFEHYRKAIMEILNQEQKKQMPIYGKGEGVGMTSEERAAAQSEKNANRPRNRNAARNSPLQNTAPPGGVKHPDNARSPDKLHNSPAGGGRGSSRPPAPGRAE